MTTQKLDFYHRELNDWKKSLGFYKDELNILQKRLGEVVHQNTNKNVLGETEHFQNQFILQKEQFDILQHDILEHNKAIEEKVSPYDMSMNKPLLDTQSELRNKISAAEKIFADTRHEFYRFISRVL